MSPRRVVFLNAMAVLERQLIAYCFDRWVATGVSEDAIAPIMGSVLNSLQQKSNNAQQGFPNNVLSFIEEHQEQLLGRFIQLLPSSIVKVSSTCAPLLACRWRLTMTRL